MFNFKKGQKKKHNLKINIKYRHIFALKPFERLILYRFEDICIGNDRFCGYEIYECIFIYTYKLLQK